MAGTYYNYMLIKWRKWKWAEQETDSFGQCLGVPHQSPHRAYRLFPMRTSLLKGCHANHKFLHSFFHPVNFLRHSFDMTSHSFVSNQLFPIISQIGWFWGNESKAERRGKKILGAALGDGDLHASEGHGTQKLADGKRGASEDSRTRPYTLVCCWQWGIGVGSRALISAG